MATVVHSPDRFSRRHLFGSGFGRALNSQLARSGSRRPARATPAPASWGEGDSDALGARLEPARLALLEAIAVRPGERVLDLTAGDGALAARATAAGASVTALEPVAALAERGRRRTEGTQVDWRSVPPGGGEAGFAAVVSCFGASHDSDPRGIARQLTRMAAPGAPIALTAWKGLMARVMGISGPERPGRSDYWSRHETARLHFSGFPELSVREHFVCWEFAGADAALEELSAPVASATGRRRLREALPDLIELYGRHRDRGLVLRADYVVIFVRRP